MMKLFKLGFVLGALILGSTGVFAQDTLRLNFNEAVDLGLKANLDYQIQENNMDILKIEKQSALLSHLPTVGISSNLGQLKGQQSQLVEDQIVVTNVTNKTVSANLNVNMPIFNSGRRILDTQSANLAYLAGEKGIERAKQLVIFDVARRYLQVLLDQELLRIANENLENQNEVLRQIDGFVDAGLRTVSDLYNQQAEVARLESVKVDAEIALENDIWLFAEYLQLEVGTIPVLEAVDTGAGTREFQDYELLELIDIAEMNRADKVQALLLKTSYKKDMQALKAMYYPRVSAFYNYNTYYTSLVEESFNKQFWDLYPQNVLGIGINIPIFTNFQTRLSVARAKAVYKNQILQEKSTDRKVFQEVKLAHQNYQAAVRKEFNSQVQVKAATEAKNAIQERFRLGLSNFVDLSTANQQFVASQADQAQAIYTLYFQDVLMRYALGTLSLE